MPEVFPYDGNIAAAPAAPQQAILPPTKPRVWGHDELAADLAAHLRGEHRMLWCDMQLGPAGSVRPDVYTIEKSFVSPIPTVYECKISTADFRSDVTSGKWTTYTKYAYRVFFAAPVGLIAKNDVPQQCGLMLRGDKGWRMAKNAVVNPITIPQEALLKLLIDGVLREGPPMRAKKWHNEDGISKFSQKFGSTAARYVCDATAIQREIEQAQEQRMDILDEARRQADDFRQRAEISAPIFWLQLTEVLGLEPKATRWDVESVIRELKNAKEGSEEARELRSVLTMLRRIVEQRERFEKTRESVKPNRLTESL